VLIIVRCCSAWDHGHRTQTLLASGTRRGRSAPLDSSWVQSVPRSPWPCVDWSRLGAVLLLPPLHYALSRAVMAVVSLGQRGTRPAPRSNYHVEPWAHATTARLANGPVAVSMGYPYASFSPLADVNASVRVATPGHACHARLSPASLAESMCLCCRYRSKSSRFILLGLLGCLPAAAPCVRPPPSVFQIHLAQSLPV
jgi:hypothetical protein